MIDRRYGTMTDTEGTMLPLEGIKVVEIAQNLAGPYAGAILAALGADVVKGERPDGGDDARGRGPPGVGPAALLARPPRLVSCALAALGRTGPLSLRPGYEPMVQAFAG